MSEQSEPGRPPLCVPWLLAIAGVKLLLHGASAAGYGYFGDELYYVACADHPAWGYVDQPPLSIAVLAIWKAIAGTSLPALRLLPALAGTAFVVVVADIARRLGGAARAQVLAAVAAVVAPVNLVVHGYFSMNAFDTLVWAGAADLLLIAVRAPRPLPWLGLGALLGVGLLNKYSVLWLGTGIAVGLVAFHRDVLRSPWPWLAAVVAASIALPHLGWQIRNGWPSLEFIRVATDQKMIPIGVVELLRNQIVVMHPATFPLWAIGLGWLLGVSRIPGARALGTVFVVVVAILLASGTSRASYLSLAQPPLLAGGALAVESLGRRPRWHWLAPALTVALVVTGLPGLPLALPILPVDALVRYQHWIDIRPPREERREEGPVPPHLADMLGWPEIVETISEVYQSLPASERADAAILAEHYSEAGAIDLMGRARGLPRAIGTHNNYWLWGPGKSAADPLVVVGPADGWLRDAYADVRVAARLRCGYCLPGRNGTPVYVARGARHPLAEIWPALRHYD